MKKITQRISLFILLTVFTSCIFQKNYINIVERHTKDHDEFSFGEVLDFEWDEAYNELNYYGRGEDIKDLTGYDFSVEPVGVDHMRRFLFFKNGELVKEIKYEFYVFEFPDTVICFHPDTVFIASWYNVVNDSVEYPHLKTFVKAIVSLQIKVGDHQT